MVCDAVEAVDVVVAAARDQSRTKACYLIRENVSERCARSERLELEGSEQLIKAEQTHLEDVLQTSALVADSVRLSIYCRIGGSTIGTHF